MKQQLIRLIKLKKKAKKFNAHPRIIERIQNKIREATIELTGGAFRDMGDKTQATLTEAGVFNEAVQAANVFGNGMKAPEHPYQRCITTPDLT